MFQYVALFLCSGDRFNITITYICTADIRIISRKKQIVKQKQISTHILMYMGTSNTVLP